MVVIASSAPVRDSSQSSKPRIISEVKKKTNFVKMKLGFTTSLQDFGKPKISGQLIWNVSPSKWHLRAAEVRNGSLFVFKNGSSGVEFRLPLRQLNLQPCNAPRTFRLTRGRDVPLVTFQALTDEEYEKWVKVLAVELIRQTPLHDVRFLDIISITRKREPDGAGRMRRGRSEECLVAMDDEGIIWDQPLKNDPDDVDDDDSDDVADFSRDRRYRSLTLDNDQTTATATNPERRHKASLRNKYNFKEDVRKRGKKADEDHQWRDLQRWCRARSVENIQSLDPNGQLKDVDEKIVSDESGISSGDENNNTIPEQRPETGESYSFVSVREKKKFFESLSGSDAENAVLAPTPSPESSFLTRSNSIGDLHKAGPDPMESTKLRRRKRTKSLHDLSRTPVPVREICRLFESRSGDADEEEAIEEEDIEQEAEGVDSTATATIASTVTTTNATCSAPTTTSAGEKNAMQALNQRRLQRGERKLAKLGGQIAEVEETIKVIAEDLKGIASNTLKRRESAEIYAALQRRLAEENSRLERLQEETSRVIKENQRIIAKLKKSED